MSLLLGIACLCLLQDPIQPKRPSTAIPSKPATTAPATSQKDAAAKPTSEPDPKLPVVADSTKKNSEDRAGTKDSPQGDLAVKEQAPYAIHGQLELKYVGRWTEGAHDNDLYVYSNLNFGDPSRHLVSGHISGRSALDMDRNHSPTHPFRSIDDSYGKDLTARLYSAYIDLNDVEGNPAKNYVERVRIGRQILRDTPETLFFDGVSVKSPSLGDALDLRLTAFVGVPNHIFESSSKDDLTYGGAAEILPWRGGQLRFDYMHVTDAYLGVTALDDLYGISGSQKIGELFFSTYLNFMESDARDFGLNASLNSVESDFSLTARYDGLLSDQKRNSIDFDFFTPIQATYFSYHQYSLFAHKGFGDQIFIDGGIQRRELQQQSNESTFNHEFTRYYLTPGIADWPYEGSSLSLSAEFWDSGGDRFSAFGGDFTHKFDERLTASFGTMFQLYRYDALIDQERQDVQVTYAKISFRASDSLRIRTAFEFENGDTQDFAQLTIGLRFDF